MSQLINNANAPPTSVPQGEGPQPTVRVMRLYKPCMHLIPTLPSMSNCRGDNIKCGPDFAISQFLLLPDSFGDIYLGELFSAYISVVNGLQDYIFSQISLSVRLQTANVTHDLYDSRAIKGEPSITVARSLNPNQSIDMVVQHTLGETGTHTLRVSVQYMDHKAGEMKPFKKFYRFNVLNPLQIKTICTDMGDRYLIQCLIKNCTKSMLYLEDVSISSPQKDIEITGIMERNLTDCTDSDSLPVGRLMNPDIIPSLLTEDTYAFAFSAKKPLGHGQSIVSLGVPEVRWCSCMGEHGYLRGDEVFPSMNFTRALVSSGNTTINSIPETVRTIRIICVNSPSNAIVNSPFSVHIRVVNDTGRSIRLQLQNKDNAITSGDSGLIVCGLSKINIGLLKVAEMVDTTILLFPLSAGLYIIRSLIAVDLDTGKEYSAGVFCKVLIYENATITEDS